MSEFTPLIPWIQSSMRVTFRVSLKILFYSNAIASYLISALTVLVSYVTLLSICVCTLKDMLLVRVKGKQRYYRPTRS